MFERLAEEVTTVVAKRVRHLPVLAEAWQGGDLSTGQVHAVVGALDDDTVGIFAEHEAAVVPALVGLSVNDTSRAMSTWKARADALGEQRQAVERERSLHLSSILGGTWVDARFDAASGEVVSLPCASLPAKTPRPSRPAAPPNAGPTLWSTCAGSSSTTTISSPGGATGPISTWWSTSRICSTAGAGAPSTASRWRGPTSPLCCVTRCCTAWWPRGARSSWTTEAPPEPCLRRCGTPWW